MDDNIINEWIKDVQIDSWSIDQNINFNIYDEKPTYEVMKLQNSWLLTPDINQHTAVVIVKNEI